MQKYSRQGSPKTVLITRFSALGDVAMTIPVVYSVCRANPDVHFVMVTRPSMATMMINRPDNLEVKGVDLAGSYHGGKGLWRLWQELQHDCGPIHAVADLHNVLRTRVIGFFGSLSGIPVKHLNKARRHRRALTRKHQKVMLPMTTQRARYREVFHHLGLAVEDRFTTLFSSEPSGRAPASAFEAITVPKRDEETWIGIAPFAKHQGKIYPVELMYKVAEALGSHPGVKLFLFGGGEHEQTVLDQWAAKLPRAVSLAGRHYGFPTELALLSHLDVMVSMDSANMHLASLVGVPVVSVWGATHPYCGFRGFHQSESNAVQLAMTCRPCSVFGDKPCHRGDYHCMRGIPPQAIIDRVEANLKKQHPLKPHGSD